MGSFRDARLAQTPPWLGGVQGEAYQSALGEQQDDELALLKGALRVRWPSPAGPADALGYQGQDRRILRAAGETDDAYAARLANAHELWYWAGTKSGLASIFDPFAPIGMATPPIGESVRLDRVQSQDLIRARIARGEPTPEIVQTHTPGASTFAFWFTNTDWAGFWFGADWFSLCYAIVDSRTGPWEEDDYWDDAGDWDDRGLWNTTMTQGEANYIRAMVRTWKPVDAYPVTIALAFNRMPDDSFWDAPGTWDDGLNWGGDPPRAPIYMTIGHVWGEEEWLGDDIVDNWDDESDWDAFVDPRAE